jgi:hypothetical protein
MRVQRERPRWNSVNGWDVHGPDIASGARFMTVSIANLQPLVALAAGILILLMPRLLNYIIAIYLIVIGVSGLLR